MVYKIVDPHNYLLMTIEGQLMRGLLEHERLKPAILKMGKGNVTTLSALKKVMNLEIYAYPIHPCYKKIDHFHFHSKIKFFSRLITR